MNSVQILTLTTRDAMVQQIWFPRPYGSLTTPTNWHFKL